MKGVNSGGSPGACLLTFPIWQVLAIGNVLRGVFGNTRYRLIVDEMPNTRDLVDLCEGIYLARHADRDVRPPACHAPRHTPAGTCIVLPPRRVASRLCSRLFCSHISVHTSLCTSSAQLHREEELQETLLRLYRSPEVLLRLTGSRIKKLV